MNHKILSVLAISSFSLSPLAIEKIPHALGLIVTPKAQTYLKENSLKIVEGLGYNINNIIIEDKVGDTAISGKETKTEDFFQGQQQKEIVLKIKKAINEVLVGINVEVHQVKVEIENLKVDIDWQKVDFNFTNRNTGELQHKEKALLYLDLIMNDIEINITKFRVHDKFNKDLGKVGVDNFYLSFNKGVLTPNPINLSSFFSIYKNEKGQFQSDMFGLAHNFQNQILDLDGKVVIPPVKAAITDVQGKTHELSIVDQSGDVQVDLASIVLTVGDQEIKIKDEFVEKLLNSTEDLKDRVKNAIKDQVNNRLNSNLEPIIENAVNSVLQRGFQYPVPFEGELFEIMVPENERSANPDDLGINFVLDDVGFYQGIENDTFITESLYLDLYAEFIDLQLHVDGVDDNKFLTNAKAVTQMPNLNLDRAKQSDIVIALNKGVINQLIDYTLLRGNLSKIQIDEKDPKNFISMVSSPTFRVENGKPVIDITMHKKARGFKEKLALKGGNQIVLNFSLGLRYELKDGAVQLFIDSYDESSLKYDAKKYVIKGIRKMAKKTINGAIKNAVKEFQGVGLISNPENLDQNGEPIPTPYPLPDDFGAIKITHEHLELDTTGHIVIYTSIVK